MSQTPSGQNLVDYGPDDFSPAAKRLRTADLLEYILDYIVPHPLDKRYVLRNEDGARIPITAAGVRRLLRPSGEDPGEHVTAAIAVGLAEIAQEYVEGAVPAAYYGLRLQWKRWLREDMAEAREIAIRELREDMAERREAAIRLQEGRAAWLREHPDELREVIRELEESGDFSPQQVAEARLRLDEAGTR